MAVHHTGLLVPLVVVVSLILIMADNLSIVTYNSHGSGTGRLEYITKLMQQHDIVLIQEHWLLSCELNKYAERLAPVAACIHGISAMPDDELVGRPHGGCAILWKKNLSCQIRPLELDSTRVCGVHVKLSGTELLLFNVYMPCDTTHDLSNANEYQTVLDLVAQQCIKSNCDHIVIAGDLNTEFSRINSLHTQYIRNFISRECLKCCADHAVCDIEYTHESKINGARSHIDHFIISENLFNRICDYYVKHEGDNMSDHFPVTLIVNTPAEYETRTQEPESITRCDWEKATPEQVRCYKDNLDNNLSEIDIPHDAIMCNDLFCNNHQNDIQKFHDDIIAACIKAGDSAIPSKPSPGTDRRPRIAGWNEHVEEHKQRAIFWHWLWKCNHSPREGLLADIRRSTRAKYHYTLRTVKQNKDVLSANSMASAFIDNQTQNFWQKVRKVKGTSASRPNTVDDTQGASEIGNIFAGKYKELYNSVPYSDDDMSELRGELDNLITDKCCTEDPAHNHYHNVSAVDVRKAVVHLKSGKHDGMSELFSDHILNSTERFQCYTSLLFTAMLKHGYPPDAFLMSTIIPIIKNKRKSKSDSDNYRGIALSSCLGKLFDWVILLNNQDALSTSEMQFGFKAEHSTTMCTYVLNETINYYNEGGSNVHAVFLDASKAFDKVHYVKLFRLLLSKGMCPIVARLLLNLYTSQGIRVKWDSNVTDMFSTSNGVKQGGVLSPILFTVYIDVLLSRLRASGLGCYVGHTFMGAVGYADDVCLLAPTMYALNKMLQICTEFAYEFHMMFNSMKSKHVLFSAGQQDISVGEEIELGGSKIESVANEHHLGNLVGPNTHAKMIDEAICTMYQRTNTLLALFKHSLSFIKYELYKIFALCLYGSPLWDFSHKDVSVCYTAWRKCMRRIWDLPNRTHCDLLHVIADDLPIEVQLHKRFMHFMHGVLNSKNYCVRLSGRLALNGSRSTACNSLTYISDRYSFCKYDVTKFRWGHFVSIMNKYEATRPVDYVTAGAISDLVYLRDKRSIPGFSNHEVNELLDYLCTS